MDNEPVADRLSSGVEQVEEHHRDSGVEKGADIPPVVKIGNRHPQSSTRHPQLVGHQCRTPDKNPVPARGRG